MIIRSKQATLSALCPQLWYESFLEPERVVGINLHWLYESIPGSRVSTFLFSKRNTKFRVLLIIMNTNITVHRSTCRFVLRLRIHAYEHIKKKHIANI